MANPTTKRFFANKNCSYNCFDITLKDDYQYGCEFEFYIDKLLDFKSTVIKIKDEIFEFSNADILLDLVSLPSDIDRNQCIQIKPDNSLEDNGIEISIPITSYNGVKYYLGHILPIIEKYGYTNQDTGLHFHISTIKKDGANFDFYLYMLMCHDKNLLSSWVTRDGYSHNVMDILSGNSKLTTKNIKNKKGPIWNLEKISSNHIEIKSMGGENYHFKKEIILEELELYSNCFNTVYKKENMEYSEKLIKEHKLAIESVTAIQKLEFIKATSEIGFIV